MNGDGLVVMILVQAALAAILLFVGSWGWDAAGTLPPRHMSEEERIHRAAVMRRGSVACVVVGFVLAASVVWVAVDAWGIL